MTVFAAASLQEVFTDMGRTLERARPRLRVRFNFAASSALEAQLEHGGSADVFATADTSTMARAAAAKLVDSPAIFARNRLSIVVHKGNPKHVRGLGDLAAPGLVVVLCAQQVPCGKLADAALSAAAVKIGAASREEDVRAVLTKVSLGEADAGIVYVTDVRAARDRVDGIAIPDAQNQTTSYPIAVTTSAPDRAGAFAFVDFVGSPDGRATLRRYGFITP